MVYADDLEYRNIKLRFERGMLLVEDYFNQFTDTFTLNLPENFWSGNKNNTPLTSTMEIPNEVNEITHPLHNFQVSNTNTFNNENLSISHIDPLPIDNLISQPHSDINNQNMINDVGISIPEDKDKKVVVDMYHETYPTNNQITNDINENYNKQFNTNPVMMNGEVVNTINKDMQTPATLVTPIQSNSENQIGKWLMFATGSILLSGMAYLLTANYNMNNNFDLKVLSGKSPYSWCAGLNKHNENRVSDMCFIPNSAQSLDKKYSESFNRFFGERKDVALENKAILSNAQKTINEFQKLKTDPSVRPVFQLPEYQTAASTLYTIVDTNNQLTITQASQLLSKLIGLQQEEAQAIAQKQLQIDNANNLNENTNNIIAHLEDGNVVNSQGQVIAPNGQILGAVDEETLKQLHSQSSSVVSNKAQQSQVPTINQQKAKNKVNNLKGSDLPKAQTQQQMQKTNPTLLTPPASLTPQQVQQNSKNVKVPATNNANQTGNTSNSLTPSKHTAQVHQLIGGGKVVQNNTPTNKINKTATPTKITTPPTTVIYDEPMDLPQEQFEYVEYSAQPNQSLPQPQSVQQAIPSSSNGGEALERLTFNKPKKKTTQSIDTTTKSEVKRSSSRRNRIELYDEDEATDEILDSGNDKKSSRYYDSKKNKESTNDE